MFPGPQLTEGEWQDCLAYLSTLDPAPDHVVASGSLPPDDFYARVAKVARNRGSRVTLDTSGPALAAAISVGVYLIKQACANFLN